MFWRVFCESGEDKQEALSAQWMQCSWRRANLNSILRAMIALQRRLRVAEQGLQRDHRSALHPHGAVQGGESRLVPDGMRWGPVVRVGTVESPEIEMCGEHHACGLTTDYGLDGHRRWRPSQVAVRRRLTEPIDHAVQKMLASTSVTSARTTATAMTSVCGGTARQPSWMGALCAATASGTA